MVYILFNVSIRFVTHDNVGCASEIKSLCPIFAEILTIFDFCGGYFEFCQYKFLLNDVINRDCDQ